MKDRILIIEDEAPIRRVMTMALESEYDVTVAADGPSGLVHFGDGAGWQAVLLDQRMPGMEGLEVLRKMKAVNPGVRVLMITAYPSIDLAVDAMKLGAIDFLRKPVTPDILRSAVKAAMGPRPVAAASAKPARPDRPAIETITMNGFRIVCEGKPEGVPPQTPGDEPLDSSYHFRVFAGASEEGVPVVVQISQAAMAHVERMVGRRFDHASAYWEVLAEDYLASYLWNDQHIPTKPIVLRDVTADDLNNANFWPTGA